MDVVWRDEEHEFEMGAEYPFYCSGEAEEILAIYFSSSAFTVETYDEEAKFFIKDKERLREFWLWWLDEAVPASWFLQEL